MKWALLVLKVSAVIYATGMYQLPFPFCTESCLKKNQNAPRLSEHPPVREKIMSKRCCFTKNLNASKPCVNININIIASTQSGGGDVNINRQNAIECRDKNTSWYAVCFPSG